MQLRNFSSTKTTRTSSCTLENISLVPFLLVVLLHCIFSFLVDVIQDRSLEKRKQNRPKKSLGSFISLTSKLYVREGRPKYRLQNTRCSKLDSVTLMALGSVFQFGFLQLDITILVIRY